MTCCAGLDDVTTTDETQWECMAKNDQEHDRLCGGEECGVDVKFPPSSRHQSVCQSAFRKTIN
jgi:hypothetical protein